MKFARTLPNIILLAAGLLLVILLAFVNREVIRLGTISGGWTTYPPLSALPEVETRNLELNPFAAAMTNALIVLQVMVMTALLYASFYWGRQTKQGS